MVFPFFPFFPFLFLILFATIIFINAYIYPDFKLFGFYLMELINDFINLLLNPFFYQWQVFYFNVVVDFMI